MAITDGMAVGWTSPMIPYFLSDKTHIKMSRNQAEWMETWLLFGAVAGLPVTAFFVEKFGRKKSLLLGTFVAMICWIIIACTNIIEIIYVSRFANGLGLNMAFVAAPMYVGEIASKEIRGFLSSNVFIMSLVGIVLIYSMGPYVPFTVPPILSIILLVIELAVFSFMPESPYFLMLKNDVEGARKSLKKFRGNTDVEDELQDIKRGIEVENSEKGLKLKDLFLVKNYRKALLIMLVVNSAQLFCSFEVILMNLHEILNSAGSVYIDTSLAAIIFSVINLVASIAASLLVDKFGRKKLIIISTISTGLCLVVLALYFNLKHVEYDTSSYSWLPIATVMVYAAVFKFGLGMVPIVLVAEIFAPKMKVIGMTIADGIYVGSSILALQVYFGFRDLFGMHAPFYIFSAYSIFTCIYVAFFLPETKGKSLDEIQDILRGNRSNVNNDLEATVEEKTQLNEITL